MQDQKKILILGGDSFIAGYFINKYQAIYTIRAISRKKTNFENELVVSDFFNLNDAEFEGIDVAINFAAIVHQPKETSEDIYIKINYKLALEFAEKAKRSGVRHFIQMSTIGVYGTVEKVEKSSPENPTTPYGRSKLLADIDLIKMIDSVFNVTVLRPTMVYGGGNAPGNMMRLIQFSDKGFPMPFKNITNQRDFIHVDTLVSIIDIAISQNIYGSHMLCDGVPVSINRMVETIGKALNKNLMMICIPAFLISILKKIKPNLFQKLYGTMLVSNYDVIHNFGIVPNDRIEEGVAEMVAFYKKHSAKK